MFPPVLVPADAAAGTRAITAEEGVVGVVDLCGGLCKVFEERSRCRLNASADKNFAMIFDVHLSGHQSFNFQSWLVRTSLRHPSINLPCQGAGGRKGAVTKGTSTTESSSS